MLDISFIRQNADAVKAAIKNKGFALDLDELLTVDKRRREVITDLEQKRARKNQIAASIPKATKEERPVLIDEGRAVKTELEKLEPELAEIEKRFQDLLLRVPSVPRPEVPVGRGEGDNVEIRRVGTPRKFDFQPKDHVELMQSLGLVDWDGPRIFAGGRSYALKGFGALLEMALTRLTIFTSSRKGSHRSSCR